MSYCSTFSSSGIRESIYGSTKLLRTFLVGLCIILYAFHANAQTTTISTGLTGSTSTSANSFVTFVVENNSGTGILLTEVGSYSGTTANGNTATLWYSSTSLSGTVGTLAGPTWTQVASNTISGITTTTINPFISGMSFLIPSGTTYRFALHINNISIQYASSGGNTFSAGGVNLYIGNYQISGSNVGYVLTLNPRYFAGYIKFTPAGPPCPAPTGATASNVTSTSAGLSWTAVTGSSGYEYDFSTSATPASTGLTSTTATSFSKTNLTPSTTYYLHVRNKCTPPNQAVSAWATYQFETNPPCTKRAISVSDVTPTSAQLKWNGAAHASGYEYAFKQDTVTPSTGIQTTDTTFSATQLTEGTKYYVFVRMHCPGGEMSDWTLDSFTTRTICRPPTLNVDHVDANYVDADRAVVYWNTMPTAVEYEYEVSQSATPLGEGTSIKGRSFYVFPLKDGQTYYFHVRSKCSDQSYDSKSDWTTISFSTFPTSIEKAEADMTNLSVSPNPFKDKINLTRSNRVDGVATITISDISGKTIVIKTMDRDKITIDMSELASGIYFLKYADQQYTSTVKVIKE